MALLAELTHRCPLQCPYCSNPLELERARVHAHTDEWLRAIREAAELGCIQVHFSGGEPTARARPGSPGGRGDRGRASTPT